MENIVSRGRVRFVPFINKHDDKQVPLYTTSYCTCNTNEDRVERQAILRAELLAIYAVSTIQVQNTQRARDGGSKKV